MNVKNFKEILLTPIIPVVFASYYLCSLFVEIKLILIIFIIVIGFIFLRALKYLQVHYKSIYASCIIFVDWFVLDLLNILSANQYAYLKPSVLETLVKNSLVLVV